MSTALIGLGANLEDPRASLYNALAELDRDPRIEVVGTSRFLCTRAIGGPRQQPDFVNAAASLETDYEPRELWRQLLSLEIRHGRVREQRWAPRTLDLDLLLYGERQIDTPELKLPHPRMSFRRFVLEPAAEIAGAWIHPTSGRRLEELLATLDTAPHYVACCGPATDCEVLTLRMETELGMPRVGGRLPGTAGSSGAAGPTGVAEIESFTSDLETLRPANWTTSPVLADRLPEAMRAARLKGQSPVPAVSSFWLDALLLPESQDPRSAAAGRILEEAGEPPIQPKLLIVIEESPHQDASPFFPRPRASLEILIRSAGPGPRLTVTNSDPAEAWQEIEAAILAIE